MKLNEKISESGDVKKTFKKSLKNQLRFIGNENKAQELSETIKEYSGEDVVVQYTQPQKTKLTKLKMWQEIATITMDHFNDDPCALKLGLFFTDHINFLTKLEKTQAKFCLKCYEEVKHYHRGWRKSELASSYIVKTDPLIPHANS